ncbi:hypothetical protein NL676_021600 [Syzygium grande]|nr:hypothetical protein NL676_021600 [Syzygium grande]
MASLIPSLTLSLLILLLNFGLIQSLQCLSQKFSRNRYYQHCADLPHLSSYLHWNYKPAESSIEIAFLAPPARPDGWVGWGINPNGSGMIGTQALIAHKEANGSMAARTFKLVSYKKVEEGEIAYKVSQAEAEYKNGVVTMFATVGLPKETKVLNVVWQVGSSVVDGVPAMHELGAANLNSRGKLDLPQGQSSSNSGENYHLQRKRIHGLLNAISWGILFPVGAVIARYLRPLRFANPFWFYLHVSCQFSSYIIGVTGWAIGLDLGAESKGVEYTSHRIIGIILFCLATLQMFAIFIRPSKDHKYRVYWNVYHHGIGYTVIILGIINVFKGLEILGPAKAWKLGYVLFLSVR